MGLDVDLIYNTSDSYAGTILGISESMRMKYGFFHSVWETYACDKEVVVDMAAKSTHSDFQSNSIKYILLEDKAIADISWLQGYLSIKASASTPEAAREYADRLKKLYPKSKPKSSNEIQIAFWTRGPHGASRINRKLIVPNWNEINVNYSANTAIELDRMMHKDYRPGLGGKLILWQGEPGTGKTTALRALTRSWKKWAKFNYITDPEKFFGSDADYMFSVITDTSNPVEYYLDEQEKGDEEDKSDIWNLLILEDCGEILAADARTSAGQGLSRFLNCVDGLIGQGLNILVLVTTNEELGKLHPAVSRPGRTASQIEFKKLTPEEASQWLGDDIDKPATIAELYARKEGFENKTEGKLVGFAQ